MPFDEFPTLSIRGIDKEKTILSGAIGALGSLPPLVGAVIYYGGGGFLSTIGIDLRIPGQVGDHFGSAKRAVEETISLSSGNGLPGVNGMSYMYTFEESIRGALAAIPPRGKIMISVGAGFRFDLPRIEQDANLGPGQYAALIPIVSSARALSLIIQKWARYNKRRPDAVIVEGPQAGGHLGFQPDQIDDPAFSLKNLLREVLEVAKGNEGFPDIPVFAAGGIFDRQDMIDLQDADGYQLATRFVATDECSLRPDFKLAATTVPKGGIVLANPGSPAGLQFRVIEAGFAEAVAQRSANCLGYMMHNGTCKAIEKPELYNCICNKLLAAAGLHPDPRELPIYTIGAMAWRFAAEGKGVISVHELMNELRGVTS